MSQDLSTPRPAAGRSGGPLSPILLLPAALYALPALASLASRSEIPLVLGRYSKAFFAFNVWSVGVLLVLVAAWYRRWHLGLQLGLLMLIATTVIIPANNQLRAMGWIVAMMPILRLVAGAAMVLTAFDRFRRGLGRPQPVFLALGALMVTLSLLDLVLFAVIAAGPESRRPEAELREPYVLSEVRPDDLILVGDSFVWGQGVETDERFGNRLEALYRAAGRPTRVFSLGIVGVGPHHYIELLSEVPPSTHPRRVIVAFYMNDLPLIETLWGRIQDTTVAFGRGFPSIRLVGDKLAKFLAKDVHAYHDFVVESYRADHPTFAARWAILEGQLRELEELAAERSAEPPLLVILPIMVDFTDYPLVDGHRRVAAAAREAGFEVLDLLPVFRESLGDGDAHRNAADDNHFDAETHDLVARTLFEALESPGGPGTAP